MSFVVPVVDGFADVDDPEQQNEHKRQNESEFHKGDAALVRRQQPPKSGQPSLEC
jgi:hypothetical protein